MAPISASRASFEPFSRSVFACSSMACASFSCLTSRSWIVAGTVTPSLDVHRLDTRAGERDPRKVSAGGRSVAPFYGVSTSGFRTGHMKPYVGCGWNDTLSAVGLPNHCCGTGALTFLPVFPAPSMRKTSTPR